jgi:hexosaminidase
MSAGQYYLSFIPRLHSALLRGSFLDSSITGVLATVLGASLVPSILLAQDPELIPEPRELHSTGTPFQVTPTLKIILSAATAAEDRLAAENLQEELKIATGEEFPILSSLQSPKGPAVRLGRIGEADINQAIAADGISTTGIGEQGYILDVTPASVVLAGKDSAGLFYGVQTLRQLIWGEGESARILGVRARDWPALTYRGAQVDLARGPVPNLNYLKRIVRTIAEFKMNQLYMYMEDSFRLDSHPLIGLLSDTLSRNDWRELVAYSDKYHIEIIPATEDCGHLHKVLRFEKYTALGERPHGHGLAAHDPQALAFLEQMHEEMLPVFPASIYHIGCDETFDLGLGRSSQQVSKRGYGQVYVDNLTEVADLVRRYKKQVMFWGDIAVEHADMIPRLPKDLIVASWEYGTHPNYEKWIKPFEGTGMKVFVCPWVGSSTVIMADYDEAAANIAGFLRDGKKAGAIGTDITVWNDDGENLYGMNWWSIVYGAACAWEPGNAPLDDFNRSYDWAFYRNRDHRFADAIQRLSRLNGALRSVGVGRLYGMDYGGTDDALFWHDPFTAEGQRESKAALPIAAQVRRTAEDAYTIFVTGASLARRNADTLPNLEFAALKIDALAMRYEFAQEISQLYSQALAHENDKTSRDLVDNDLEEISGTNGRLQDLRDYTTRLRELYKQIWLSENLPTWLPNIMQRYDGNSAMWRELIAKFDRIKAERGRGKPLPSAALLGLSPVKSGNESER